MPPDDRWLGLALALLAGAVLWSASGYAPMPGQRFGAGLLPALVGGGLLLCGLGLIWRGWRARWAPRPLPRPPQAEQFGAAAVIGAAVVGYIGLAEWLGFLIVAPLVLLAAFRALRVRWATALPWALAGTAVVHLAFYKLLRVPLPWGLLRPFY